MRTRCAIRQIALLLVVVSLAVACSSASRQTATVADWSLPPYVSLDRLGTGASVASDLKVLAHKRLPSATRLAVLVHGWHGDALSTWGVAPQILSGAAGDSGPLAWTRSFSTLFYGYDTFSSPRELDRQARLFATQLRIARSQCGCTNVSIVAHSMGALLVARALANALLDQHQDPEAQEFLAALRSVLLVAPALRLRPEWDTFISTYGRGQVLGMAEFSEFRRSLDDDLVRLKQSAPEAYTSVFMRKTVILLADDDRYVDNSAIRSEFRDIKMWHLEGDHTGIVKVDGPTHQTMLLLAEFLKSETPFSLAQLPFRLAPQLDLDSGEISDSPIRLARDQISVTIKLRSKNIIRESDVAVSTAHPAYGFFVEAYEELRRDIRRGTTITVRIVREPVDQSAYADHAVHVFLYGRLWKTIPIFAEGSNLRVYRIQIDSKVSRGPKGEFYSKESSRRLQSYEVADLLLSAAKEEFILLKRASAITASFIDYVANADASLSAHGLAEKDQRSSGNPMVLKWLGVSALRLGLLAEAYDYFRRLSQIDTAGNLYVALTLVAAKREKDAATVSSGIPSEVRTNKALLDECGRYFGEDIVRRTFP